MVEKINGISRSNWKYAPQTFLLPDGIVHIWCASLNISSTDISKNYTLLSADEKKRAEKKVFLKDRNSFIVARGILRNILSRYLHVNPAEIELSYSPGGKPYLTESLNCKGLSFNLSHSYDMALYAFTLRRKIGVDLEYIRQDFDWNDIADIILSAEEKNQLREVPENNRREKFYSYWTRKESFLKSIGAGLTVDPREINVLKQSDQSVWVMQPNRFSGRYGQWSLLDLDLGSDYASSLAVEGEDTKIQCWKW